MRRRPTGPGELPSTGTAARSTPAARDLGAYPDPVSDELSRLAPSLDGKPATDPPRMVLQESDAGDVVLTDGDRRRAITGLPAELTVMDVHHVDGHLVLNVSCPGCNATADVYVVRDGARRATRIANDAVATPARSGLWLWTAGDDDRECGLQRVALDGTPLAPARPLGCDVTLIEDTTLGLLVRIETGPTTSDYALLDRGDPSVHIVRYRSPSRIHAVVGEQLLASDDGEEFRLVELATGTETPLPTPDALGYAGQGIVSRDGRYVAIEYRSPAQYMDLVALDMRTERWIHAPSMPVYAFIKRPEPIWAPDGRLTVLGWFGREDMARHLLATWRPGDEQLSVEPMGGGERLLATRMPRA